MGDDNWSRMSKFISQETIQATCEELFKLATYQQSLFSVVLHGGEPLLLGVKRLERLFASLRNALSFDYPISIQTNGVLISKEILDICSKYQVSVAVSIDGPQNVHDKLRIGHDGEGTFERVIAGIALLRQHPDSLFLNAGLLAVIDPSSDPAVVYNFFKTIQAPSVDFLYKDGNHDRLPMGKASIGSREYGTWMSGLLKVYLDDPVPLPIRVLDDMLKVILGGEVSKEGLGITDFGIIIIDTDGTIMKNDTLKSSYNGADRFISRVNIKGRELITFIGSEEFRQYRQMQLPTNNICLSCPQLHICGAGMILHRWSQDNAFNNPSVYCADQLYLIDTMRKTLIAISQYA